MIKVNTNIQSDLQITAIQKIFYSRGQKVRSPIYDPLPPPPPPSVRSCSFLRTLNFLFFFGGGERVINRRTYFLPPTVENFLNSFNLN